MRTSDGVVTFRLGVSDGTTRTRPAMASTIDAQSVAASMRSSARAAAKASVEHGAPEDLRGLRQPQAGA